jgi:hypothetical protein
MYSASSGLQQATRTCVLKDCRLQDQHVVDEAIITSVRLLDFMHLAHLQIPIPVIERSKARVCGRSLVGVAGLNPAGDMDVCVVCCKYREKAKCWKIK